MVFPYLTSLFSKKSNKTQLKPTIFDTFPELNQGQAYLEHRNKVQQAMRGHLNLIESFTMHVSPLPVPTCKYVAQAQPNVIVPCKCGNTTCSSANPYCNSETKQCYNVSSNAASVDWGYKASCPAQGQASSCSSTAGCPNYGFCPPTPADLLWKKDGCPGGSGVVGCKPPFDTLNTQRKNKTNYWTPYILDVSEYVLNRPNDGGPTGLWGQNVVVPQLGGPAPWGPGNEPPPPPSPECPPNTCVSYKGSKYRTLTGFDPNNPIGAPQDSGCENTSTASIPKGWQIAPANEDSKTVVGLYDWGTDVLILGDGQGYNTKNYAANYDNTPPGAPFSPGNIYGTELNTATPQVGGCYMAILLKTPPPVT